MEKDRTQRVDNKLKHLLDFLKNNYSKDESKKALKQDQIASRIGIDSTQLAKASNDEYNPMKENSIYKQILEEFQVEEKPEGFEFRSPENWTTLAELARQLSLNLVDVSTNFYEKNIPHLSVISNEKTLKELEKNPDRPRQRFVIVTGAGASHAATGGKLLMAKEATQVIKEAIKAENIEFLNELIAKELNRLKLVYKARPDDFETILVACSKFRKDTVVAALKQLCGNRYIPALSYEIMAHLLKHRIVDSIINFNYDEILDNAIEEEISNREYFYIYSDGHCPNEYQEMLIDNRLKQPVFIKPHGTISHINSLRFTREAYFSITPEIRDTIYDLFKAKIYENPDQDYLPLNLIIIGFSMQSIEFNSLIRQYLEDFPEREIKFWFFDKKTKLDDFDLDLSLEQKEKVKKNARFFDLNMNNLEEVLIALWALIEKNFKEEYQPRGIQRHRLLHALTTDYQSILSKNSRNNIDFSKIEAKYFKDRFFIELLITVLQSDGILVAGQIVEERAGKYYHLYEDYCYKTENKVSLRELLCEDFGLKVLKELVWDTYVLEQPDMFYDQDELGKYFFGRLKAVLEKKTGLKDEQKILQLIHDIRKRNLMKITPNYIHPHNNVFSRLKKEDILNTSLSWIYRYRSVVEKTSEWDLMLVISEKGRFLNQDIKNGNTKGKKVELILSSFDSTNFTDLAPSQSELFAQVDLLSKKPLYLPWWVHNQHMAFFLKRKKTTGSNWRDNWILKEGFYYQSRLLSRKINPVHITDEKDNLILLYTFANYWYRAKVYTKDKEVPIVRDIDELEAHINELLSAYDDQEAEQASR